MLNLLYQSFVLLVSFGILNSEVYNDRPKVKATNGDLILEPAYGRNIYLKRNGPKSTIFFGGIDLKDLMNATKDILYNIPSGNDIFRNDAASLSEYSRRIERLESITNDLVSNINHNISRLTQRINTLSRTKQSKRKTNECRSNPCANGGTCLNLVNSYHCLCPSNWKGDNCDEDVNECTNYAGTDLGCQNGATCINKPGSYECICKQGWYGVSCTKSTQNCSQGDFEMCGHGICIPVEAGIRCICSQGWTTDGKSVACLTDVDECQSGQGIRCSINPRVECINIPGSFRCGTCPAGYEGDGFACYDIDECLTVPNGGCSMSPMVSCHNTIGSRICGACPPGYQGDGISCTWRGSCALNNGGCHPSAVCVESTSHTGLTQCFCPAGMDGDGIGIHGCYVSSFDNTTQRCENNPCGDHGHCHPLRQGYTCICYQGYSGAQCNELKNVCTSNPCHNGGTCKIDERVPRGYKCECTALYSGDHCQIHSKPCGGVLDYEEGSIIYPLSNTTYNHNARCAWVIHTAPEKVINVTFSKFNLESDINCMYDFVQIHDGRSSASQLIGRFCGNSFPKGGNIISSHNNLYFWFRSDHSVAKEGFSLHWTSILPVCGGEINATSHGHIRSPGSPGPYPPNRDCYWHLTTTLGKRIQIHFFELDIELHMNCSFDFLAIYDGRYKTDPLINRYCNSTQPAPIQSAGSDMLIYFHSDAYNQGKGFQITYAPIEGVPGCGGFFTQDKGEIVSPSFDGSYLNNMLCEYKIKTSTDTKIRIEIKSFHIERSQRCRYDFLKIYDGSSEESPLVGRFCGNSISLKYYTSSSNNLYLVFKSDHSTVSEGFKITYESICQNTITGDSGIIKSTGYPMNYRRNVICDYIISSTPGKAIVLTFQDFDIEDNKYYNCPYDYVEIRDGHSNNSRLLGRYCGSSESTPPVQTSTYNYLYIRFKSDRSVTGRGFYANYTTINIECGGIYRANDGIINHPMDNNTYYSSSQTCTWMLIAPEGMHIKLTWNRFELENMPSCTSDYVLITEFDEDNKNNTIGKYCGNSLPPALTTSSSRLMIKFESDSTITYNGFSLSYSFLEEKNYCGGYYTKTHGYIYSPGWPKSYEPKLNCIWTITVPAGQQIVLNISNFDLEGSSNNNCRYGDYLSIRDGSSENSTLIGMFCGSFKSKIITTTANNAILKFHSNFYFNGNGFQIEWDGTIRGCGGTLTDASGSISSPNYPLSYNENSECFYRIVTSSGSRIRISFTEIDLEKTKNCNDDYVEIFDGRDSNSVSFGKLCQKSNSLNSIETSNNLAFIKFRSDFFISGKGFLLNYNTICTNNISSSYGVIESPGYPNTYPLNINCHWTITAPKGNKINATFTNFDLYPPTPSRTWSHGGSLIPYFRYPLWHRQPILFSCNSYLQFKETSQNVISDKKCGSSLPSPINTTTNSLEIFFFSGNYLPRNGFRLEWVSYGCGGHIRKRFGTLSLDPKLISSTEIECEWIIETPIGTAVSITFLDLSMPYTKDCSSDVIELYNGQSVAFPLLAKICHEEKTTVQASSNYLFVKLIKMSRNVNFHAKFNSLKEGCGGKIESLSGIIHSKHYPKNYENNLDCVWILSVPLYHRIELTFLSFDLYSSYNSDCGDSIKIYDSADILNSNYTMRLCPKTNITRIVSDYSTLKIQFQSDHYGTAKGFKANFTMTCGAVINTTSDGIISNSQFINHNYKNCTWIIFSPNPSDKIKLTIQHISIPKVTEVLTNRNCPSSFIRVLDGNDGESPLIDEFCGRKVPPTIISHGSALTILLGTYTNKLSGQFTAHYTTLTNACGGTLTSEEGTLASPNYPMSYPTNVNCEWIIRTSPGNRVYITFENFDLNYSENCNEDYLEIRENNKGGQLLGIYCGQEIPVNTTTGQQLYLKFYSDNTITAQGFVLHYGFLHGNEITGLSNGEITSPLYPFPYDRQGEYNWRIITETSTTISISIDQLEIHKNTDICDSKLLIYDGYDEDAPLIHESCGILNNENNDFQTSSNIAFIKLILVEPNICSLFHIKWKQTNRIVEEKNSKINCGLNSTQLLYAEKKIYFNSPKYPEPYDPDLNCIWIFSTTSDRHLSLSFEDISLEQTPSCFADYISIFSLARTGWSANVENMCLAEKKQFVSIGSTIKVNFKSDSSMSRKGFNASVSSICGGTLRDTSGIIKLSWFDYKNQIFQTNLRCNWTVKVRPGRTIKINFIHFNITNDNECNTYVVLKNGESNEAPSLGHGKFCGYSHEDRNEIISTTNSIFLSFVAKKSLQLLHYKFMNFMVHYEEKNIECGLTSSLDANHKWEIITSPNYPNQPPVPYTECIWIFTGPPGEILRIDFVDRFDLEISEHCISESVEIRDGSSKLAPLKESVCKEKPGTIKTSSNRMFVKYSTQIAEPRNGFKANISIDTCGGTLIGKSGEITSPGYPHMSFLAEGTVCQWHIISLPLHVIHINFNDLQLPESVNPCETKVTIEEMIFVNNTSELFKIKEFCDYTISGYKLPIETLTNKAIIKLYIGKPSQWTEVSTKRGFRISFNSSNPSCGGDITNSEGYFTTPGYPRETSLVYCGWIIKVPNENRRITLELIDYDNNNDLSVFNDLRFRSRIEKNTNQNNFSTTVTFESTGNVMSLYLYANSKKKSTLRFKAKFTSNNAALCGGTLHGINGKLQSPDLERSYSCAWKYNGIQPTLDTNDTYSTLSLKIKITTSLKMQYFCRLSNSQIQIRSNIANNEVTFARDVCSNNTDLLYNIPARSMNIKAIQNKLTPIIFDLNWKLNPCGGLVHAGQSPVNVINVPIAHNVTLDCAWLVITPVGLRIELKLEGAFNLGCTDEYILINQGLQQHSLKIGDYCKDRFQEKVLLASFMHTYIQYHSGPQNNTNVKLNINTITGQCGGYLTKYEKIFTSPNYPSNYREKQECVWEIHAEIGYRISLQFIDRFAVEETLNCTKDVVIILDWKNYKYEEIARICGRRLPQPFNSTSNHMKVIFRSDETNNLDGFKAKWIPICGGILEAKEYEQFLYSPGYNYAYYPLLNCEYEIINPKNEKAIVKFLDFDLEGSYPECESDNVTIVSQNSYEYTNAIYCEKEKPPPLYSSDKVQITFKTDGFGQKKGFKLSFVKYSCGGYVKQPKVLSSGTFGNYFDDTNCTWYIEAPVDKVIILKFLFIDLESSIDCYNDYIAVYDGPLIDFDKRLSLMCGHVNNTTIIKSKTNIVTLNFVSDSMISYTGFKVEVLFTYSESVGCGGQIELENTSIKNLKSPLIGNNIVYENYLDCHWSIKAPQDHVIGISFSSFHIASCANINQTELGFSKCDCDYVEIKDGLNPNSLTIGTYCGHTLPPYQITSSSNFMAIRFSTDGEETSSGFEAILSSRPTQCGQTFFMISNTTQSFKSPGYTKGKIPRGLHCNYLFDASTEPYSTIHIRINNIDLEPGTENKVCDRDRVIISSYSQPKNTTLGNNLIINENVDDFFARNSYFYNPSIKYPKRFELCGQKKYIDYYVSGNVNINIQTSPEDTLTHTGIELELSFVGFCGRNYTELYGRIQTQIINYNDLGEKDCLTLITVPENYTISVYFINVSPVYWNELAYLEIFDGNTTQSTSLLKVAKEYQEIVQVFSSGRYLLLHNHIMDTEAVTYDINYISTTKGSGCGGILHNTIGRVTSPLYPNTYRSIKTCEWELETPIGSRIMLHFLVFDLGRICNQNYVSLVDRNGNLISTYCSETPADFTSVDNYVKIVFTTTKNNAGTGWVADFTAIV